MRGVGWGCNGETQRLETAKFRKTAELRNCLTAELLNAKAQNCKQPQNSRKTASKLRQNCDKNAAKLLNVYTPRHDTARQLNCFAFDKKRLILA
jgi:hypothetical protein